MNKIEERWERDNIIMKKELIDVAHNFSPQFGYRHFTRNAVHFSSKNFWYQYRRNIKFQKDGSYNSWIIEVYPTVENPEEPYEQFHHTFEVMMPEEYLDDKIFFHANLN